LKLTKVIAHNLCCTRNLNDKYLFYYLIDRIPLDCSQHTEMMVSYSSFSIPLVSSTQIDAMNSLLFRKLVFRTFR